MSEFRKSDIFVLYHKTETGYYLEQLKNNRNVHKNIKIPKNMHEEEIYECIINENFTGQTKIIQKNGFYKFLLKHFFKRFFH